MNGLAAFVQLSRKNCELKQMTDGFAVAVIILNFVMQVMDKIFEAHLDDCGRKIQSIHQSLQRLESTVRLNKSTQNSTS